MGAGDDMAVFISALDDLDEALDETVERVGQMKERIVALRASHERGIPLRQIVPMEQTPLLVQLLTQTTALLHAYGNRVRRTEARALHQEGLTMDEIASLFGVTRQRVSALLRSRSDDA